MDLLKWARERIDPRVRSAHLNQEGPVMHVNVRVALETGELVPIAYDTITGYGQGETWDMIAQQIKDTLLLDLEEKRGRLANLVTIKLDDEDRAEIDEDWELIKALRAAAQRVDRARWKRIFKKHGHPDFAKDEGDCGAHPHFESYELNEKHQYLEIRIVKKPS